MSAARILVVDDESEIRGLLKEILADEGYEVDVAADAVGFGELLRQRLRERGWGARWPKADGGVRLGRLVGIDQIFGSSGRNGGRARFGARLRRRVRRLGLAVAIGLGRRSGLRNRKR
jgi:hypothetical protein